MYIAYPYSLIPREVYVWIELKVNTSPIHHSSIFAHITILNKSAPTVINPRIKVMIFVIGLVMRTLQLLVGSPCETKGAMSRLSSH